MSEREKLSILIEIQDIGGCIESNARHSTFPSATPLSQSLEWLRNDAKEVLRLIERIERIEGMGDGTN